jgi:hypothetical protein
MIGFYDELDRRGLAVPRGLAGEVYPGFKRLSSVISDLDFTLVRRLFLTLGTKANPFVLRLELRDEPLPQYARAQHLPQLVSRIIKIAALLRKAAWD